MTDTPAPAIAPDLSPEIVHYVTEVRRHLLDLDADELDEMLDDLVSHLREVQANTEGSLADALGPPEAYAAELRTSADLPPVPPPPAPGAGPFAGPGAGPGADRTVVTADPFTLAADRIRGTARRVQGHPWWQSFVAFLPELRPAWWVARGYLLVGLLSAITSDDAGAGSILAPPVAGSHVLGLIVLAAAVVGSVRWGRARYLGGRQRWVWLASGLALIGVIPVLDRASTPEYVEVYADQTMPSFPDGSSALNVYAYLPDGTPIDQVLLFDENGQPLVLDGGIGLMANDPIDRSVEAFSNSLGLPVELVVPTDPDGQPVPNQYPRDLYTYDQTGDGSAVRRRLSPPDLGDRFPPATALPSTALPSTTAPSATVPSTTLPSTTAPSTSAP